MVPLAGARLARITLIGGMMWTLAERASAQGEPQIGHEADDCWPEDQFPSLEAAIEPGEEILSAKVYFRSEQHPDFYYVEMHGNVDPDQFLAILPKPSPETERVIYYVEAIDSTFSGGRTEDYDPEIKDPCKRRSPAAYTGANPEIIVGATKAGASALPPGFQAVGIAGFITAAGVSSAVGGGLGVGTAVAIAGAAAAAGGAVVVAGGGETTTSSAPSAPPSTTTSPPVLTSTTTAPSSTTTTSGPSTSTTTSPVTTTAAGTSTVPPSTTTSPATTTVPPSTTTSPATTSAPTTTTSVAATTTIPSTTTTSPSTTTSTIPSTTTTSVSSTTTTAAAPPVNACFTATKVNSCVWRFNAACSTGPITDYNWEIDPDGNMPGPRPPVNHTGQNLVINWNPPTFGGCSGSPTIEVQLTVVGSSGQTDTASQSVRIDSRVPDEDSGRRATFTSFLSIPPQDGRVRGFVVLNDALRIDGISNATPTSHPFRGRAGENVVEGHVETSFRENGFWKFDFSGTDRFVSGSLRAQTGNAVSNDGHTLVFRLSGAVGERIRFSFELEP